MAEQKAPEKPPIIERIRAVEDLVEYDRIKLLLTGPSGTGKSRFGALFERPLIGLTERQAIRTIRRANPKAKIFMIDSLDTLREFKVLAASPNLHKQCDAIILDSLTDAQRIIKDELTKSQTKRQDITDENTWGVIVDETAKLARVVRDAVVHTVLITVDLEVIMDIGVVHRPGVSGKKLPNELAQYVNAMGFMRKDMVNGEIRRSIMFESGPNYPTKSMEGLRAWEPPEPAWILRQVFGDSVAVPEDVLERVKKWEAQGQGESKPLTEEKTSSAFD